MRFESLHLDAFGRFRGVELRLAPGLDVIFGPNESGKSTIARFIRGMLYGFAKPLAKRRDMSEEFELSRPWSCDDYRGRMIVSLDDGRRVRVERSFDPPEVRILDDVTGSEIPLRYDRRREPTFFAEALSLSQLELESTACVGQLQVGSLGQDAEAVKALATRMASGGPARPADPARKALELLHGRLEEIGTERAPSRPYAKTLARLEEVRDRLAKIERLRQENLQRELERKALEGEIASGEARLAELDSELASADRRELRERLRTLAGLAREAALARDRVSALEQALGDCAPLSAVSLDEPERLARLFSEYRERVEALARLSAELDRTGEAVRASESKLAALGLPSDTRTFAERLDALERTISGARQELARRELELAPPPAWGWVVAAFAGTFAATALAFAVSKWFAPAALAAALFATFLALRVRRLARARAAGERENEILAARIRSAEAELAALVGSSGAPDVETLRRRLAEARAIEEELTRERGALDALGTQAAPPGEKLDEILRILAKASPLSDRIRRAIESRTVGEAELQEFVTLHRTFVTKSNELAATESRLLETWTRATELAGALARSVEWAGRIAAACEARDAERLVAELAAAEGRLPPPEGTAPRARPTESVRAERRQLERTLSDARARLHSLAGRLEEAYRGTEDQAALLCELEELDRKIAEMDLERRAIERAKAAITAVASEMRKEFVPRLSSRLGPIARALTRGRYADVKVGEGLELTVQVPETGLMKEPHHLSEGASEQLHFALRIAAALELTEGAERVPLVCDDTLAQFDDERAIACLEFLAKEVAPERQVILFTCRRRERDAAERLGATVIEL